MRAVYRVPIQTRAFARAPFENNRNNLVITLNASSMAWEYAALEMIYNVDRMNHTRRTIWVLRKNRPNTGQGGSRTMFVNLENAGEILYSGTSSIDVVNLAGGDGWEMTGQLPIAVEENGRKVTCSMMRRRIE